MIFATKLLTVPKAATTFINRGFTIISPLKQHHLEQIGATFLDGYHLALQYSVSDELYKRLAEIPFVMHGFAYEGAAMALSLLDNLDPFSRKRLPFFLSGPARDHLYMVHVGAGWAAARLPWPPSWSMRHLDPLLRGLAIDGYGFHQGYFYTKQYVDGHKFPRSFKGFAAHIFYQGLGRSLWFSQCADPAAIKQVINSFSAAFHPDFWSGVGLAAAYAGGVDDEELQQLYEFAGMHAAWLGQGAAFAAKARERAGNPAGHTDQACRIFTGFSAIEAASITDRALDKTAGNGLEKYMAWRGLIREEICMQYPIL